jgi:hypothetical protein
MSLIQRAGRVGRTCDGVVYRLMSDSVFQQLDDFSNQPHSMDSVVLSCLLYGSNASRLFGEEEMRSTLTFLASVGVQEGTPIETLKFLQQSRLGILSALLLWNLVTSCTDPREGMWITLLVVIWEQYDKKSLHWVYHPRKPTSKEQRALYQLADFRQRVSYEKDMLVSIARMLLTILSYGREWRTVAASLSLNQKNIREFVTDWNRTFAIVKPLWVQVQEATDVKGKSKNMTKPIEALLECLGIPEAHLPKRMHFSWEVMPIRLDPDLVYKGRCFFLRQPILYGPKLMESLYHGYYLMDDDEDDDEDQDNDEDNKNHFRSVYHEREWMIDPSVYRSPAIPESFRIRFPKAIHPLRLRDSSYGHVVVWTNLPHNLRDRHDKILDHAQAYQDIREKKQKVRELQKEVVCELGETVAMMPPSDNMELDPECRFSGGYLWQQAEEDFAQCASKHF